MVLELDPDEMDLRRLAEIGYTVFVFVCVDALQGLHPAPHRDGVR